MHWKLLDRITHLRPGESAVAAASTSFPEQLYRDHFPTFEVTPGVLLLEQCAQLGVLLMCATVWEQRGVWVFPVLTMVKDAKFRSFVPPDTQLEIHVDIEELRPESGLCKARVLKQGKRCANARLVLAFDPDGETYWGERAVLEAYGRSELQRLQAPWTPAAAGAAPGERYDLGQFVKREQM